MDDAQSVKRSLKKWELSFYKNHGRKPQRTDIDEAPEEIKEAYAKYNKLKREQVTLVKAGDNPENDCKKEVSSENKDTPGNSVSEKCEMTTVSENVSEVWGREFDKKVTGDNVQQSRHEQKVQDLSSNYLQGLSCKLYQNAMKFGKKAEKKSKPERKDNSWRRASVTDDDAQNGDRKINDGDDDRDSMRVKGSMFEKALSFTQKKNTLKRTCTDEVVVTDKYSVKSKSKFSISVAPKNVTSFSQSDTDIDEVDSLESCDKGVENKTLYSCDVNEINRPGEKSSLDSHSKDNEIIMMRDCKGDSKKVSGEETGTKDHSDNKQDLKNDMKRKTATPIKTKARRESSLKSPLSEKQQDNDEKVTDYDKQNSHTVKFDSESATVNKDVSSEENAGRRTRDINFCPFDFDEKNEENMEEDLEEDHHSTTEKIKGGRKRMAKETPERPAKKRKNISSENEASDEETRSKKSTKAPRGKSTAAAPASVGNFVRLNMRVKTYKRKGKGMTGQQYKRFQWKQKMKARSQSYGNKCFKCGQEGHWSNKCPETNKESYGGEEDKPPVLEEDFPTMKEAAMMAKGVKVTRESKRSKVKASSAVGSAAQGEEEFDMEDIDWDANMDPEIDEELEIQAGIVRSRREENTVPPPLSPLVNENVESCDSEVSDLLKEGLKKFGYDSFRLGQEKAISRILAGKSTLVVMSTGGGKSLCYQLPAYLYAKRSKVITLVISPLVSLMEDQISGLPQGVKGACLHTNMTPAQREGVLSSVKDGKVHFLLVSPEAVAGGGMTLLNNKASLPPLAFVCIDEAHCLSEWSHNFRPSYLRLTKVLREKFGVQCFLGLTATATKSTAIDVAKHLDISDFEEAVIRGPPVPKNLFLSVSRDDDRDQALIGLLQGERFSTCESIIVYCTRREQTERLATLIRTCLKDEKGLDSWDEEQKKRKGKQKKYGFWDAESYHAGLSPAQRKRVQNAFMSGRLRVVVATVAFGMGLDKSDVRGVIHYNMPKSFEGYVQEIGRAGRDGKDSQCHLFLDSQGQDLAELRRHTHSNTVDYRTLKKFVQRVFYPCRCKQVHEMQTEEDIEKDVNSDFKRICPGHERALSVDSTVMELDVKEEGISTLLCYLELHPNHWVENLVNVYSMCKIQCYGGPSQLQTVAKKCPPVAVAIAKAKKDGRTFSNNNSIEFHVVEISDCMGWDSGPVKRDLKLLSWQLTVAGPKRTGVLVEFSDLAFHFRSPGDLTDDEQDDVLQFLHERIQKQEKEELEQLDYLYKSLKSVSHKNYWMCSDSLDQAKNEKLRTVLRDFFQDQEHWQRSTQESTESNISPQELSQAVADIRQLISVHGHEHRFNGRAIARILHGIGSPCFPATTWGRNRRFWRVHMNVDFNFLIKVATQELIKLR